MSAYKVADLKQEVKMKINPVPFALASAITAAVLWIICSLAVFVLPGQMMSMSGEMVHANLSGMHWNLSMSGVLIGLVGWVLVAGIFGWIVALVYNLLNK